MSGKKVDNSAIINNKMAMNTIKRELQKALDT